MRRLTLIVAAALLAALPLAARAQPWPAKPVRVIVPFAPGGTADTLGRIVCNKLSESFGQSFIVENRGGAGGMLGAEMVAKSAADGYTLGVTGLGPLPVATALAAKPPYDPLRDFTHIALFGGPPSVVAVHPSLPARDLAQFVALARARPGAINYGTAGNGSTGQMLAELFRRATRIDIQHVPYKGAGGAVIDLVAGHIQAVSITLTAVSSQLRAGRARALAMSSAVRLTDFPEVPTFREAGYPELVASVWFSLSGPAGLPADIVARLNLDVRRILLLPEVRDRLRPEGIETNVLDARGFTDFVAAEVKRWTPLVLKSGARSE
ncbi:MAG: tripartite tricarboxylate transporter substrate binding protein [Burkholderiales bacterium]